MSRMFWRFRSLAEHIRSLLLHAPAARWTVITCLAVFLVQLVCSRVDFVPGYSFAYLLWHCFGLCPALFAAGFFWQLLTYMFLHLNWAHLVLNGLAVLLLGAGVEMEIGTRRFLRVFLLGGIVGGLAWVLFDLATVRLAAGFSGEPAWLTALADGLAARRVVTPEGNAICLGASGGVFALVGACAALFPRRQMLLFLVWPVRTRRLAIALGIGTIIFAIYGIGHVAHLTHLVGGIAGYVYGLRLAADGWGDE
ncbi:MAG: rhomboid family intramembrane serine protease [Magnetococcus sp. WYHC-3]